MMSWRSPENVIVANREQRSDSLSVARASRSYVSTDRRKRPEKSLSGVTLRDLIEREGEGS